jgi:ABC-type nitrate/sulfonate/bicarbonate transport system permease component
MAARHLFAGLAWARGLLPLVLLLAVWQLLFARASIHFPPPLAWWDSLVALQKTGLLGEATLATLGSVLSGFLLASACGLAGGLLIGVSRTARRILGPLLEFFRALPPPVIVPVLILWLGYAESLKLLVVVSAAIWPVLLNVSAAITRTEPLLLDVARSFKLSRAKTIWKILIPASMPEFFLGMRVALPLAVVVTLLVEILTSLPGIGSLMTQAQRNYQSAQLFGLLVVVGLLGFSISAAFTLVEKSVVGRWQPRR